MTFVDAPRVDFTLTNFGRLTSGQLVRNALTEGVGGLLPLADEDEAIVFDIGDRNNYSCGNGKAVRIIACGKDR